MTAEVLDYRIKQIKHITGVDILDDKSFDEALYKLIGIYSNLKKENMQIKAKAIDEFKQELLKHQDGDVDTFVWCSDINRIAEQMKGRYSQ
jgi:hypothetical protein